MTAKPCPPDLAAFKHEPADYEQPVEDMTVEQLAACPFCQFDGVEITHPPAPYAVSCLGCYAEGPQADSRAQAIAAWNTRTQATEAMREALYRISDAHLPDQPATSSLDETEWAIQHIRRIRAIARAALSGDSA